MPVNKRPALYKEAARALWADKLLFNKDFFKNNPVPGAAALTLLFLFGVPSSAFAQASSLGDVFCNLYTNAIPFAKFFQWAAYIMGAVCTVQGIYHLRGHTENPANFPLHRAIMLWFGAACLLVLPSIISTIVTSLYGTQVAGGAMSCAGSSFNNGGSGQGLDAMMANFVTNIKNPLLTLISIIAIACGLYMIVHGLHKASKYGFDPKTHSISSILSNIVFGALLMTIGENMNVMLDSVFGGGASMSGATIDPSGSSVLQWGFVSALGGGSQQFAQAIAAALIFFQLIGAIAFVRGWLIMKKVVEGGGNVTMAQGITHILGGVLAINIGAFLQIMDNTFGTGLLNN